jgi:phosphonate transport system permease protein
MTLQLDAPAEAPGRSRGRGRRPESVARIRLRKLSFIAVLVGLPLWALARSLPDGAIINPGGLPVLRAIAASALQPALDPAFLRVVADAALTTVALALLGTVGALLLGLVGGVVLADAPWNGRLPSWARVLRAGFRLAFVAVRAIHELVWALLFVSVLGFDPFAAVLALALPFGAQSAQVFGETFDAVDDAPLRALRNAGASGPGAVAFALFPAAAPLLLSYSFYRFECALRSVVVLGVAGVGGLGFEVTVSLQSRNWDEVWTIIAVLVVLAAVVEFWSNRVRTDMAVVTCADWSAGSARGAVAAVGLRRSTRWSLYAVVPATIVAWWWAGLSPYSLVSERTRNATGRLVNEMWPPGLPDGGWPVLLAASLDTVAMAVLAMTIAVVLTLIIGPWAARPRADRRGASGWGRDLVWLLARLILLVLRTIPPTVWAIVALLAFFPGVLPGAIALGLYTAGILARLSAEAWETMDLAPRNALRTAGVPRLAAGAASLAPPSVNHLLTYTLFRFEICVRDTAIVGVVGAAGLGRLLDDRLGAFDFPVVTSVLIASLVVSLCVEVVGRRVRRTLRA